MKIRILSSIVLSAGVAMLHPVHAASPESGITIHSGKQTQEQERIQSQGMSIPPSTSGAPNRRHNVQKPRRQVAAPPQPYKAERGALTVLNCSGRAQSVRVYNRNDAVKMVPYMETRVNHNRVSRSLKCAVQPCIVYVGSHGVKLGMMGPHVYKPGRGATWIVSTNYAAQQHGCSIY